MTPSLPPPDPPPHVRIAVVDVRGSAPREPGAFMLRFPDGRCEGTIGGGNLELRAIEEADRLWRDPARSTAFLEFPLSTELGQCCGGMVRLFLEKFAPPAEVLVCGAGHVATALARSLDETPLRATVVDPRPEWADPARFPAATRVLADDPEALLREWGDRAPRTFLLVMTHQHPLDEALCRLALRYPFRWIGLIGSRTKWLRFRQRLAARGFSDAELARIVCPIGDPALGRTPAEIAVGVAAQLLAAYHAGEIAAVPAKSPKPAPASAARAPGLRAGLILAGGASSRMGRWKGGLDFRGEPLVVAHARVMAEAGAEIVKAVYPESVRAEAERLVPPARRLVNSSPEAPMFASLQAGVRAIVRERPDVDSILVSPVDAAPVDPDLVAALWDRLETTGAWIARPEAPPAPGEAPRAGHPIVLDARMFAPILAADPDDARLDFLARDLPPERVATLELPGAEILANMNTPEDYAKVVG